MAELIAYGSTAGELEATVAQVDLPPGTKMRLEMTTTVPIAPLANLWGAGWVIDWMLDQGEAEIVDVEGVGWNKVVVHMKAKGAWVPIIIAAIIALCAYFGWQWFKELRLFAERVSPMFWGLIAVIAAAMAIPLVMRLTRRRGT